MDPAHFYAANGWGSTASIGQVNMLWIGAVGVSILRAGRTVQRGRQRRDLVTAAAVGVGKATDEQLEKR